MRTSVQIRADIKSVSEEIMSVVGVAGMSTKAKAETAQPLTAKLDQLEGELQDAVHVERATKALNMAGVGGAHTGEPAALPSGGGEWSPLARSLAAEGKHLVAPPRLTLEPEQKAALYEAARSLKSLRVDTKAIGDSTAIAPAGIPNYVLPPVPFAREPMRVLSLMPNVSTDRPIEIFYQTQGTTNAGPVDEGQLKPESAISYLPVQVHVTKIAHYVSLTDESLEDFSGFNSLLSADMVNGVIDAENRELLSSVGTGASKWSGLLNQSGVQARAKAGETYSLDVIEEGIDDLRVGASFTEPTDIVMNPTTWGSLRRTKDTQNRYLINPDPTAASRLDLWGFPVTLTTQIPVGTALIGDFAGGCFAFIRRGILVESTNNNEDDFVKNLTTVRAETRIGLCVTRPKSFNVVTGL